MNDARFIERSKKDLEFIFKSFNDGKFNYNNDFTEKVNCDLEDIIVTNILATKFEGNPKTEDILKLHNIQNISIKHRKPFLSFITKQKESIEVKITAIVDYYWIVDGQESSIPGEIEKNGIHKNKELSFNFRYKEIDNHSMLVYYWDDNGCDFGESRTWSGKPELMKKYRENPDMINEN